MNKDGEAKLWSVCCLSSMRVVSGNEGTNSYVCNACDKPCNWTDKQANPAPVEVDEGLSDILIRLFESLFPLLDFYPTNASEDKHLSRARKDLLAWRDKAVVAELTKAIQADDNGTGCYSYIADRLSQLNGAKDDSSHLSEKAGYK